MPLIIDSFTGPYRWLSNFWPARVWLDGEAFPTVEHAYQAAKTLIEADRSRIKGCFTPGDAKRAGRLVALRQDWLAVRVPVMRELLREKFTDPDLRAKLVATGDAELVEGNTWGDTFWGVCRGKGENTLGSLLMELREELRMGR